eukprot:9503134-Heterocapsa_arctica.AAC.1
MRDAPKTIISLKTGAKEGSVDDRLSAIMRPLRALERRDWNKVQDLSEQYSFRSEYDAPGMKDSWNAGKLHILREAA